ncbi:hypothetical protein C5Y96_13435 [Blastopirellula marina]|uniref:Uncharacterized protein n=1 Tax=Blastopirellula marina TaxID=124 RepID=A0A2S8FGP3_9BACT|nr:MULTISPECIES: hypothetical protein [Pirellulaceae]PQO31339.1 hypothetical protein C5Y96_13435 [Blastopirellula marina]RCS51733.1 hypothetical protein DTL36_13445 [Bremerella cremea]
MSGGYYSCGEWMGEDKTGTAFLEIVAILEDDYVSEEEMSQWDAEFADPLREQLEAIEDDAPYMELSSGMMNVLVPIARRYFEKLESENEGLSEETFHESEEGWQWICLKELWNAFDAQKNSGELVVVHYD